jgi:hypothetical protein
MHTFKPPPFVGIPRMGANRLRSAVIVLLNIVFSDNRNCAANLSLEESFCHITFRTLKVQNPCKRKKTSHCLTGARIIDFVAPSNKAYQWCRFQGHKKIDNSLLSVMSVPSMSN